MPYTIQDALGDERAFLEAVCDVMPLHFPLLSATALAEKLRMCNERMNSAAPAELPAEQSAGSSADLATFLKNYGEVYADAVRVPPIMLQREATEAGLASMAFSLVNAADDIFFKTLPLLATDNPQAELSMPSCNLETDWDMNDIIVHVVRMYKKSCTKVLKQYAQHLQAIQKYQAGIAAAASAGADNAAATFPKASQRAFFRHWTAFVHGQKTLLLAALETRESLKAYLLQRMHKAYAGITPALCAADTAPQDRDAQAYGAVLWKRWTDHVDSMEEYFFERREENPLMAMLLATILSKVARHEATSAALRDYIRPILDNEAIASAVHTIDIADLVSR